MHELTRMLIADKLSRAFVPVTAILSRIYERNISVLFVFDSIIGKASGFLEGKYEETFHVYYIYNVCNSLLDKM